MPLPHPYIDPGGNEPQSTVGLVSGSAIFVAEPLLMPYTPLKIQPSTNPPSGGGGGSDETHGYATAG
jgi:hypothetical protein